MRVVTGRASLYMANADQWDKIYGIVTLSHRSYCNPSNRTYARILVDVTALALLHSNW
jgi:hypothetical protein